MTIPSLVRLALRALSRLLYSINLRRVSRELHTMPDFLLKDIGITRSSISYVVVHGRREEPITESTEETPHTMDAAASRQPHVHGEPVTMPLIHMPRRPDNHPDRVCDCEIVLEPAFESLANAAVMAGWSEDEVEAALLRLRRRASGRKSDGRRRDGEDWTCRIDENWFFA